MLETHIVVSGDANFSMKQTSLTVGGSINPCATYLNWATRKCWKGT